MKIEVDLNDVFLNEDGEPCESFQESVERQVVCYLTERIEKGIGSHVDAEVTRVISEKLKEIADTLLPDLAANLVDAEYKPVSQWGDRGEITTFRKELVKIIKEKLVYKRAIYDSDKNIFTKTVDDVISENMNKFKDEFNKLVTHKFRDEALNYAITSLKKTLKI